MAGALMHQWLRCRFRSLMLLLPRFVLVDYVTGFDQRTSESLTGVIESCAIGEECHHQDVGGSRADTIAPTSSCAAHGTCKPIGHESCSERVKLGHCTKSPLSMAAICYGSCEEGFLQSELRQRFLFGTVISERDAQQLVEFAPQAVSNGDGYSGNKRPFSQAEYFGGIAPSSAALWAMQQPVAGGRRERAVAWAWKFVEVVEKMRNVTDGAFHLNGGLLYDFIHLTCRRRDIHADSTEEDSHPTHADNCYFDPKARGLHGEEICVRARPMYWWRSHTAVLGLNSADAGDFVGGDFFYTPTFEAPPSARVRAPPRAGQMFAFDAGSGNIHGVEPVTNGTRCQLSVWFTDDYQRAAAKTEIQKATDVLNNHISSEVPEEGSWELDRWMDRTFVAQCNRPRPAVEIGSALGELPLPSEHRSLRLWSLGKSEGPQVTYFENFLLEREMVHLIAKASEKFGSSAFGEGIEPEATLHQILLTDDPDDALFSGIIQRVKLVTGMSLESGEKLQVSRFRARRMMRYAPTPVLGSDETVSRDDAEAYARVPQGSHLAALLLFLNDVDRGGAMAFMRLNLSITPRKGSAILVYNLLPSRKVDTLVQYGACPVEEGDKYSMEMFIHAKGHESLFGAALESPRFVRDWRGLADRLHIGGAATTVDKPLMVVQSCSARAASGQCTDNPFDMARSCSGHCQENATESSLRLRTVVDDVVDSVETADLLRLALHVSSVGNNDSREERPLSPIEIFRTLQPREAMFWVLQQPDSAARAEAAASVRRFLNAAQKLRAEVVRRFSATSQRNASTEVLEELHFDQVHLGCRKAAELPSNDSRRLLLRWTKYNSPISREGDLLEEEMTWSEAERRCLEMSRCQGFTFFGPPSEKPQMIFLKDHAVLFREAQGWSSYVKKAVDSGVALDSHPPHADACHRTKSNECRRSLPSHHWLSFGAVLYLHGPESEDFVGGDFFYQALWDSPVEERVRVTPRAGRMVAYGAGPENIHGVEQVVRGTRCALTIKLTADAARANAQGDFQAVETFLAKNFPEAHELL
eukprot:TRINITY_DN37473_c0_g1_i1.p1 TRINITY_DN37473_c0_g1~~TRINITY_DN37473_c0_g1_i1.p1  ORF type:complete len:1046 (+),score=123.74 TRINITY_DN37473_c0_g1_i1:24-3140(+)